MSNEKNYMSNGLPKGWKWKKLCEVCVINPPKSEVKNDVELEVSFVPMADLQAKKIDFIPKQTKKVKEVYSGYTYFRNNDVLLAKVTPCFENGKSGIARNLINGIGFGSSEYYVFRPNEDVLPEYIYHVISNPTFLKQGEENMSGAVGLQRVTKSFIENYRFPLPPLPEQMHIVSQLDAIFVHIDKATQLVEENLEHLKHLLPAALNEVFEGEPKVKLGDIITLQRGFDLPVQHRIVGEHKIIGANGVTGSHIDYKVEGPGVITGRSGSIGLIHYIENNYWPLNTSLYVKDFKGHYPKYIYFLLRSISNEIKNQASFTAVPTLDRKNAQENIYVKLHSAIEQLSISRYFDSIINKQQQLQQYYTVRLHQLTSLKASLLDAAFKGELTTSKEALEALEC